jgi:hypothetical protein
MLGFTQIFIPLSFFHYRTIFSKVKYKHTIDLLCLRMDFHKYENIMQKLFSVKSIWQNIFKINLVKLPKTSIQPISHNFNINKLSQNCMGRRELDATIYYQHAYNKALRNKNQ